ncbi:hypothetical protein FHS27_004348 [Rhodopirellula rubra]|uniref:3-keto-alpha-glucoside-1,2-lyase/3-keto-2-hydroxy-glucal hydratase domain-containing protein n=1 Tax=Aporhodopirellula rubra TaxID=980271 RepID=A0A7W5E2H4_9BACT|nr:family 16 glycoside hydrolase [Aporhodopirellula rubra]MBB3208519.1 hypothetical protein [Aporhodopirellula rubra]
MNRLPQIICSTLLVSLVGLSSSAIAEKNASLDFKLGHASDAVLQESFEGTLPTLFRGVKGEWKIADGSLIANELAADKHAAVLNVQKSNRNSAIRLSFKFDGTTKGFNLSLNHKGGHLYRVGVSPSAMRVSLDKDKKDPTSKAVVLGTTKAKFAAGQWYTLQVEMQGDRVVAQCDNGAIVEAQHAKLDTDKPNYRIVMKGDSLAIDDITVWE